MCGLQVQVHEFMSNIHQCSNKLLGFCVSVSHIFCTSLLVLGVLEALMQIYLSFPLGSHYSRVRKDIMNSLKMRDPCVTIGSFDRKNLFYGVKSFSRGALFVDELVGEVSKCVATAGSTIIYCTTIKDVQQVILPMSLSLVFIMFSHNHFCQHTIQIILFGCMVSLFGKERRDCLLYGRRKQKRAKIWFYIN